MFRGKEHYDKPETALARLELESPICSGSVNINAQSPTGADIDAQKVNITFERNNDFLNNGNNWD